ncbi:MAG: metalloregulator ArsR/SmtB family transcription factor [Syntrophales bacterium]|jgi:ArsR family transcriptional regulator|nr:metalloregulator ArsR/SmtB family transcription factor [Syntrophales bacterium]MDY0043127.1 metalloregulator ArsR/SmtB family transcription factor [Syntrophales bacterium]
MKSSDHYKSVDYDKMSDFFKAAGNPTRLKILMELVKSEKCVKEVEKFTGTRQVNISQHLAVLKRCGIIDCRKDGNLRCYFLKEPEIIKDILNLAAKRK